MKKLCFVLLLSFITSSVLADTATPVASCGKGYQVISCSTVENAKRDYFCWKKKVAPKAEKISKICQTKENSKKKKSKKKTK